MDGLDVVFPQNHTLQSQRLSDMGITMHQNSGNIRKNAQRNCASHVAENTLYGLPMGLSGVFLELSYLANGIC